MSGRPRVVSLEIIQRVRALLEDLLSHREIAMRIGISRSMVGTIARGEHSLCIGRQSRAERLSIGPDTKRLPRRCPTCGGQCYMPCQLCKVKAMKANRGMTCYRKELGISTGSTEASAARQEVQEPRRALGA